MKNILLSFLLLSLTLLTGKTFADHHNLYRVTLLRAEPGNLMVLLDEVKKMRKQKNGDLVIMRHSQGDHWDLMLMDPAGKNPATEMTIKTPIAFHHAFLATSKTGWAEIKKEAAHNGLYHIEMFHAAAGKEQELLKQRRMENAYYHATERKGNLIFSTTFGSDVDSFTLGFYKDMPAFAFTPNLPEARFEKAATDAGFKDRDDIGLYLRQLITSHHDTIAVRVSD